jgi:hypothetical protein
MAWSLARGVHDHAVFFPGDRRHGGALAAAGAGGPTHGAQLDLEAREHKQPAYLALNPAGVVPTLVIDGQPICEAAAIALHLADAYPARGFAPATGTLARAADYRWMFFLANASGHRNTGARCIQCAAPDAGAAPPAFEPLFVNVEQVELLMIQSAVLKHRSTSWMVHCSPASSISNASY